MKLAKLLQFIKPEIKQAGLAVLLSALTIGASISLMSTSALLISMAALHPSVAALSVAVVGVRFFGISRGLLRYAERLVSHSTSFKVLANIRVWLYQVIEPIAPAGITRYRLGDLLSRILADVNDLENFFVRVFLPPAVALLVGALVSIFLGMFSPILGLTLFGGLVAIGLGVSYFTYQASKGPGERTTDLRASMREQIVDLVQGMPDILSYGREHDRVDEIEMASQAYYGAQAALGRINAIQTGITNGLVSLTIFMLMLLAIPMVNHGKVEGIHLAVIILAGMASFEAVQNMPQALNLLGANLRSAGRLFELQSIMPSATEPQTPQPMPLFPTIEYRGVTFAHADELTLQGVDLILPPGKHIAIVGKSGAGKTSLAHLLLRFWDVSDGAILLDGIDVRQFRGDDLRKRVTLVAQDTYLFNTTIKENLRLANPSASDSELEAACKVAGIWDKVDRLPKKLDTIIGERGFQLSGGERQRLSIARAVLKDTPIWILDEPTSNLDPITEQRVLETLQQVTKGRTVMWITHQRQGLDQVDEIIVLQDGRVNERGTLAELEKLNGEFTRLMQDRQTAFGRVN